MRNSLLILIFFAGGVIFSIWGDSPEWIARPDLSAYALYLLMLIVGIGVGADKAITEILRKVQFRFLLIPVGVIAGSLAGTLLFSLLLYQISFGSAMAVGAGFGYYSLTALIISQMYCEQLGVVALLANMIREVLTLILAPVLVKLFGNYSAVASGGATAMDTTLPVIIRYSGKEMTIIAILSGVVLSILVPVIVPFILTMFT